MLWTTRITRVAALFSVVVAQNTSVAVNYAQYVNPLIGTEGPIPGQAFGGGDIFVGGAVPFDVVKFGIDTYETNLSLTTTNGGYTPQGLVTGVSLMHESGTGSAPKYGIVHQMPLTIITAPVNILDNTTYWQKRVGNETVQVGYYSTNFENGVKIQLSATCHSGIVQYDYPVHLTSVRCGTLASCGAGMAYEEPFANRAERVSGHFVRLLISFPPTRRSVEPEKDLHRRQVGS